MGYLLLEGGAEFGGGMAEPDRRGLELAGDREARIAILPTAAAPDQNHKRAGSNGVKWFRSLGAAHIDLVPVIDQSSADAPALAKRLRSASLIYLLGGFPRYLAEVLRGSGVWKSVLEAYEEGAVIAGSSAGAMVLCDYFYDPQAGECLPGLNLLRNACLIPHHNSFGKSWAGKLVEQLPEVTLIGIDEQTGILDNTAGVWTVYGAGTVTIYSFRQEKIYAPGDTFNLGKV